MIWANFLHFYQPPTQKRYWVDRVTDECYRRVVKGFLENPNAKVTLNINSVLCELWEKWGHGDVLDGIKKLMENGQVELTGSAKFHPLLPQFPKDIIIRQVRLNDETHRRYFGNAYKPRGFFPPEMAYNRYVAQVVGELGFEWIIGEELSLEKPVEYDRLYEVSGIKVSPTRHPEVPSGPKLACASRDLPSGEDSSVRTPQKDKSGGLHDDDNLIMFFRDRGFSYKVLAGYLGTGKLFLDELKLRFPDDSGNHFLLTAMDGETFGHHRPGMERLLLDLFKLPEIELVHISDLLTRFPNREVVETRPSTWALMEHEVEKNLPFSRWDDPENAVHKLQWELTNLAIETVRNLKFEIRNLKLNPNDLNSNVSNNENLSIENSLKIENCKLKIDDVDGDVRGVSSQEKRLITAQSLLDRAIHSDQFWWASAKPWWSVEYIERGAKELLEAVKATGQKLEGQKARELYYKILETAFEYQRSGLVDEISRKEDETMRMRTDQTLPKMPKEELLKIIDSVKQEMLSVAGTQEYERAAQLRDRVKELNSYLNQN